MEFLELDELLVMFMPVVMYWVFSGLYEMLGSLDNYRLHSRREEELKNLVSKRVVVKGVILQQVIQVAIALLVLKITGGKSMIASTNGANPSPLVVAGQFLVAMVVFDAWQCFVHRIMHLNKFLYRNFHSWHHRLVAPYAFGAQYNHPIDGILTETLAGALAFLVSGMSTRTSAVFFSFTTVKGIDDHCGLLLPWNPFHLLFSNNTAYHDIHHQLAGSKGNFAQPFFVTWDRILGTYVPYSIEKRAGGGFEARPRLCTSSSL